MFETMNEIIQAIMDCEYVQKHGGSDHAKTSAKIEAYDEIKYILFGNKEVGEPDDKS